MKDKQDFRTLHAQSLPLFTSEWPPSTGFVGFMALWKGGASVFSQNTEDNMENDSTSLELVFWHSAEGPFAYNLKLRTVWLASESLEIPNTPPGLLCLPPQICSNCQAPSPRGCLHNIWSLTFHSTPHPCLPPTPSSSRIPHLSK